MRTLAFIALVCSVCIADAQVFLKKKMIASAGVAASGGGGPVGFDTAANTNITTGTTMTLKSFGSTGANRVLLVGVGGYTGGNAISSVTYNGSAMTLLYSTNFYDASQPCAVYYTLNPASGTHDVVATFAGSVTVGANLLAVMTTNANQSSIGTPEARYISQAGSTGNKGTTVSPASAVNDLVVDFVTEYNVASVTPDGTLTTTTNATGVYSFSSYKTASSPSTSIGWTWSVDCASTHIAVAVKHL